MPRYVAIRGVEKPSGFPVSRGAEKLEEVAGGQGHLSDSWQSIQRPLGDADAGFTGMWLHGIVCCQREKWLGQREHDPKKTGPPHCLENI